MYKLYNHVKVQNINIDTSLRISSSRLEVTVQFIPTTGYAHVIHMYIVDVHTNDVYISFSPQHAPLQSSHAPRTGQTEKRTGDAQAPQ